MEWIGNTNDVVEVKDISVAAYLFSLQDVRLLGKKRLPNGSVLFQFSPKNKVQELIPLYWNSQAPVIQPKQLFSALRDLKDLLYSF